MSKEFLNKLNGDKKGEFKRFIDSIDGDISIAWYPSACGNFNSLADIYIQTKCWGLKQPDLFICSDYHASGDYPISQTSSLEEFLFSRDVVHDFSKVVLPDRDRDKNVVDDRIVNCYVRERLNKLSIPLHTDVVCFSDFDEVKHFNGSVVFLMLRFSNHPSLSRETAIPVIYFHAENEAVAAEVLLPNNAQVDLIYHCSYGGGFGGGFARGNWLENVLRRLRCKTYIKFDDFDWQNGDHAAVKHYPVLAAGEDKVDLSNVPQLDLSLFGQPVLRRIGKVYLID